uniref:Cytochrome c oxidase subunit 3 n=1 Tax=Dosinia japonica TaxID=368946 RepID=A0A2U8JFA9_9BIVA|nr:cytochrome c oxidase subunit III [Dosinia japonica]AWK60555.1 cytochrome c oxidase subunit III [Dosinia japonica]
MARTGYQLVDISPWPLSASFAALGLTTGMISLFCEGMSNFVLVLALSSFSLLVFTLVRWWGDVILESTFLGCYSSYVVRNLRCAMFLFILSEVFFFVSFFWGFFNGSVGELSMQGVGMWPPKGINPIYPWRVPFLNTIVLLSSALTVTWAHKAVSAHNMVDYSGLYLSLKGKTESFSSSKYYQLHGLFSLGFTILLGLFFTYLQATEYYMASFSICDSIYGSTFFLLTGFHGMHVMVGTIFLIVCWFRLYLLHFSYQHHYFGLDAAVYYWHFVDVVWIGVFASVYVWGY